MTDRRLARAPARRVRPRLSGRPLSLGGSQLLVHGDRDDTVSATMARAHHEAETAAGDRVELSVFPGGRFEYLDPGSPAWTVVVAWPAELG